MAMTNRIFCEPAADTVAHSPASALFVTDSSFHDWAEFMCEASVPAAAHLVEASKKWPNSRAKNETAYNVAFNTDLPFFDHLATLPDRTRQFAGYMKNVTSSEGTSIRHLLNGFDWGSVGTAQVIDVSHHTQDLTPRLTSCSRHRSAGRRATPASHWLKHFPTSASSCKICRRTLPKARQVFQIKTPQFRRESNSRGMISSSRNL